MNNESSQNVKTTKKRTDAAKVGGAKRYFKSKSTGGAAKQAAKGAAPAKSAKKQAAKPAAAAQAKKQPAKTAAKPQQKRRYSKKANGTPLHLYAGANHSLETADVLGNLDALRDVMQKTQAFVAGENFPVAEN